ncbi:MAG TPA: AAA family ATPase [Solirubrobacteraceae bacterium]|nr:AAA family ATPase [Solirubrobacteraceae bacterium]
MGVSAEDRESSSSRDGLFGRDLELDAIYRLIDPADPAGGALVLRGDPGIGKSALLSAARVRAAGEGLQPLETAGAETETELPFAGLERLLRPILHCAAELPERQRSALLAAVGTIEGAAPDLFLIALGALNLITEAASRRRLLLLVDDAQWLDRGTADVLAFIARRIGDEPIATLVATREGYASPLIDSKLDELPLAPLDDGEARALLDARSPQLSPTDRSRVVAEAEGNPLALLEFAGVAGGAVWDDDGQLPGRLPLTERLERAFAARAQDLPEITRAVLLVVAANDSDVLAEALSATSAWLASGVDEDSVTPAADLGLVEVNGIRISFPNPLVRSATYQAASPEQRRQVHAALAESLAGEPDRATWHRAAATSPPDEEVASELESVAGRAERRGAIATAIAGLERAAMLSADSSRRGARLLRAAELAVQLGRADLVERMTSRVSPETLTRLSGAREALIRDQVDDRLPGDESWILRLMENARVAAAEGDAVLALDLLRRAAWRTWWATTDDGVRDRVVSAAEALPVTPDDPRLLAVLGVAGPLKKAATVIERLTGVATGPDDDPTAACLRGVAAHVIVQSDIAVQLLGEAAVTMRVQGRLGLLAQVLAMQAWSTIQLGNWSNVDTMGNEATRLARETEQRHWAALAQAAEAAAAGMRGEIELAEALAAAAELEALATGRSNVLCIVQIARGLTALGRGRYDEAYNDLVRVFDRADPAYHFVDRLGALGYLVEAAVHTRHQDRARELVEELEGVAVQTPAMLLQLGLLYARPLVADVGAVEAGFVAALEANLARWPFFRARVELAYGEWLRRQRRLGESRVVLRRARDAFDAIGATPWGERVREQLRASGEKSREPAPIGIGKLTPQERQIAELAASGLTNREIGEQLFLSPRTVASHLYRLFPKLGIASRAELSTVLAHTGVKDVNNSFVSPNLGDPGRA